MLQVQNRAEEAMKKILVHPTAIVEPGAHVGRNSQVWHHAHVRSGARIGNDCILGKNVFIDTGVRLGDGCKIQNNVSIFHGVTVDDEVFVGPSAVFTNDRIPRATGTWEISPTAVHRGASIGANATILCGITIGAYSMVAAGAVATRDVEPHAVVVGNPAVHIGTVCRCGAVLVRDPAARPDCDCMEENP